MCVLFVERDDTSEYILPEEIVKLTPSIKKPVMTYKPAGDDNGKNNKSYSIFNDLISLAPDHNRGDLESPPPPIEVQNVQLNHEIILCDSPPESPRSIKDCSSTNTTFDLGKRKTSDGFELNTPSKIRKINNENVNYQENPQCPTSSLTPKEMPISPPSSCPLPPSPPKTPFRVRDFALEKNFGKPIETTMLPPPTNQPPSLPLSPVTINDFLTCNSQGKKICRKEIIINIDGSRNVNETIVSPLKEINTTKTPIVLRELQIPQRNQKNTNSIGAQHLQYQRMVQISGENMKSNQGQIVISGPHSHQEYNEKNLFIITRVPNNSDSNKSGMAQSSKNAKYTVVEIPRLPGFGKNARHPNIPVSIPNASFTINSDGALVLTNAPPRSTNNNLVSGSSTPLRTYAGKRISMPIPPQESATNNTTQSLELEKNVIVPINRGDAQGVNSFNQTHMTEEIEIITIDDSDSEDSPGANINASPSTPTTTCIVNTEQSIRHSMSYYTIASRGNITESAVVSSPRYIPCIQESSSSRVRPILFAPDNTFPHSPQDGHNESPTDIEFISVSPPANENAVDTMDDPLGINSMATDPLYTPLSRNDEEPSTSTPNESQAVNMKEAVRLRSLKCFCGRGFKYRNNLEVHRRMHRCSRGELAEEKPHTQEFSCSYCHWKTHTNFKLYLHMKRYHESALSANKETEALEVFPDVTSIIRNPRNDQEEESDLLNLENVELNSNGFFKCQLCKKPFSTKERLAKHIDETCRLDRYKCDSCDYTCPSQKYLKSHQKFVHSKKPPAS